MFHTSASIRRYMEQAELLLTLRRALYERTQPLTFQPNTPLYVIHNIFPDFIRPLRVTIAGVALRWTSLAAVGRLDRGWSRDRKEGESFFMVGKTLLGFCPPPDAESCLVTYVAQPPTTVSTPAAAATPLIGTEWHESLPWYAMTVALAREGEYQRAAANFKEFIALAGVARDKRFLEGLATETAQNTTHTVERKAND